MKKLLNKKGFTLMEMMIVIAIIVILVAISIPTFSGSLNKANSATDAANLRAAKGLAVTANMDGESGTASDPKWYDIDSGELVDAFKVAGKCDTHKEAGIKVVGNDAVWADSEGNNLADANQKCPE